MAWWIGGSTWSVTNTIPSIASGPTRSSPRCTAPTNRPMTMANSAGRIPRSTIAVHQPAASARSARGRTPKNFHSLRTEAFDHRRSLRVSGGFTSNVPLARVVMTSPFGNAPGQRENQVRHRAGILSRCSLCVQVAFRGDGHHFFACRSGMALASATKAWMRALGDSIDSARSIARAMSPLRARVPTSCDRAKSRPGAARPWPRGWRPRPHPSGCGSPGAPGCDGTRSAPVAARGRSR